MTPTSPAAAETGGDPVQAMVIGAPDFIAGQAAGILEADPRITVAARPVDGAEAVSQFRNAGIEAVVYDIGGDPAEALTTISRLLHNDPDAQVIMISTLNFTNVKTGIEGLERGAAEFLQTPAAHTKDSSLVVYQYNLTGTVHGLGLARRRAGGLEKAPEAPAETYPLRRESMLAPEILLIASSTGGPKALLTVLEGLSSSVTAPILIAQHMPPAFTASLARNIGDKCGRPSGEGKDGEILEDGHVYVAPGDKHMVLEKDGDAVRIRINDDPPENYCRPSADPLLRTAAGIFGAKILVTVLTGMGSDGAAGSRQIVDAGGTVIAQNEETCVVWGMPRAVAVAGLCSHVLPLEEIAGRLNKLAGGK